jgi:diguanylate cyclase (GGDEF)-like protein
LRATARIGEHPGIPDDLRQHVAGRLGHRIDPIAADAADLFSRSSAEPVDRGYAGGLARLLVELLAAAIGDGRLDGRGGFVGHVRERAAERTLPLGDLFTFVYLCERAALDELALDPDFGVTNEAWPLAAQLVRRASFEAAAALAARSDEEGGTIDRTTGLLNRQVFDLVVARELERAARFSDALALVVIGIDRAAELDRDHGHGVAEQVVERVGVLVRGYFRRHDWIARYGADSVAILLTRADAAHAASLAQHVRATVEARLPFAEHRAGQSVRITVSAAVVEAAAQSAALDPERLYVEADAALGRARRAGGNRVERIAGAALSRALPRSSPSA